MGEWVTSLRLVVASMLLLCVGYTALLLGGATVLAPRARMGSLVEANGALVGSSRIAQGFTRPDYLWPRPSAADYAANAASGSNLSPTNPAITARASKILAALGATPANPAPPDLVLASGSGLDPDITLEAALYQAPRIARARRVDVAAVERVIRSRAATELGGAPLVNVLHTNIALDRAAPAAPARAGR